MYDIPGGSLISNCDFYTENIFVSLDHQLKPIAMQVKSYIRDTNDFLKKLRDLSDLPEESITFTIDVAGVYPSIPDEEGMRLSKTVLEEKDLTNVFLPIS